MRAATQSKNKKKTAHGRGIKAIRGLVGITQEGLGNMIGMSPKQIYALELKEEIEKSVIIKVADALGVPAEWIEDFDPKDVAKSLTQYNKIENRNEAHDSSVINENDHIAVDQTNSYYEKESVVVWAGMLKEKDELILQLTRRMVELECKLNFLEKK